MGTTEYSYGHVDNKGGGQTQTHTHARTRTHANSPVSRLVSVSPPVPFTAPPPSSCRRVVVSSSRFDACARNERRTTASPADAHLPAVFSRQTTNTLRAHETTHQPLPLHPTLVPHYRTTSVFPFNRRHYTTSTTSYFTTPNAYAFIPPPTLNNARRKRRRPGDCRAQSHLSRRRRSSPPPPSLSKPSRADRHVVVFRVFPPQRH